MRPARPFHAVRKLPVHLLLALFAATSIGCGQIELPVTFALVGDNAISLEIPAFPPPNVFGSRLVGGAEATVIIDLNPFELITPHGLMAAIQVDRVLMAAEPIDIFTLSTGIVCVYDDVASPGGGFALLRPLRKQADFHLTLNTLISPTDPLLLSLFPDPLPFEAAIDETIPLTLADLFGLLLGRGAGRPLLGGSIVTADVTLATVNAVPSDPLLTHCEDFLATP
jgi:hypothetical protein